MMLGTRLLLLKQSTSLALFSATRRRNNFLKYNTNQIQPLRYMMTMTKFYEMYDAEKYFEAAEYGERMLQEKDDGDNNNETTELIKFIGLSYFHSGDYVKALPHLERQVASQEQATTAKVKDWFNIVTASVLARQPERAKEAYERCLEIHKATNYEQEPSIAWIRFYYACALRDQEYYVEALEQITKLKEECYKAYAVTDYHFLYVRNVPTFDQYLILAESVLEQVGLNEKDHQQVEQHSIMNEWMKDLSDCVDEEGQEAIAKALAKRDP